MIELSIATHNAWDGKANFPALADITGRQEVEGLSARKRYRTSLPNRKFYIPKETAAPFGPGVNPIDWDPSKFIVDDVGFKFSHGGKAGSWTSSYITWIIGHVPDTTDTIAVLNFHATPSAFREEYHKPEYKDDALRERYWHIDVATLTGKGREFQEAGYLVFAVGDLNRLLWGKVHPWKEVRYAARPHFDRIMYLQDPRIRKVQGRVGVKHGSDHHALVTDFTLNLNRKETPGMATPMTPAQWERQLKKFDVPYRKMPGWDNIQSGRDQETGLKFGPVNGCMIHHTGSDGSDANNRKLIMEGRSDLPGRLAHAGLNDDGVLDLMTCWRANHAGGGDGDVLKAVIAENYGKYPPKPDKHNGEPGAVDGNDRFYGLETYYWKTLTKAAYKSMVGWAAAICDFHGWTAKSAIGHKEWSDWKPDPNLIDMAKFRQDVDDRIAAVNGKKPVPEPEPKFVTPNISKAIAANIAYDKALSNIGLDIAQDEKVAYRVALKKQRNQLRDMERK